MDTVHCQTLLLLIAPWLWGHSSGTNATYFSNWLLKLPTPSYSCIKDVLRTEAMGSQAREQGSQVELSGSNPEAMAHTYPWAGRTLQNDSIRKALNKEGRKLVQKQTSFPPLKLLPQSSGHGEITLVFFPMCERRPLCFICCPGAFLALALIIHERKTQFLQQTQESFGKGQSQEKVKLEPGLRTGLWLLHRRVTVCAASISQEAL